MEIEWVKRRDGAVVGTVINPPSHWEPKGLAPRTAAVLHKTHFGWNGVYWPQCGWDADFVAECATLDEAKAVAAFLLRVNS